MTTGDVDPQSGETEASPPPPVAQEAGGLGLRFGARVIDGIIVLIAAVAIGFVLNMLIGYWGNAGLMPFLINGIISGLLTFIYFVAFETSQGWTPGKKVLGLSVHGPGGAPKPTVQQSAIRNAWTLFPIIPLWIGNVLSLIAMIWIAVTIHRSSTKQGKHDELAGGTQVVKG